MAHPNATCRAPTNPSRIFPYLNRLNGQKAGLAEVTKSVACPLLIEKGVLAIANRVSVESVD
jgi:hypothetical protein